MMKYKNLLTITNLALSLFLLLNSHQHSSVHSFTFVNHILSSPKQSLSILSRTKALWSSSESSSSAHEEAQRLLEKAAQIRKQLAELEGKTLSQVEKEAQDEKESRQLLLLQKESSNSNNNNINDDKKQQEVDIETNESRRQKRSRTQVIYVPETIDDQIRQASYAIERAFQDKITRQTVRLALVKQDEPSISPEEEEWPGGAKQMYREAGKPLTEALLSEVRAVAKNLQTDEERNSGKDYYPPKIMAQDIWDFDGSALITAEAASGPSGDVQALVFPNTDVKYLNDIAEIDKKLGKDRLFLLINPFWRNIESWGFNLLQPKAKQKAQSTIYDNVNGGYEETYVFSRFSVRGEDCVALKVYPNDWELFAYIEDYSYGRPIQSALRLGSQEKEPTSKDFAMLLNERDEFKMNKTMRQLNRKI